MKKENVEINEQYDHCEVEYQVDEDNEIEKGEKVVEKGKNKVKRRMMGRKKNLQKKKLLKKTRVSLLMNQKMKMIVKTKRRPIHARVDQSSKINDS